MVLWLFGIIIIEIKVIKEKIDSLKSVVAYEFDRKRLHVTQDKSKMLASVEYPIQCKEIINFKPNGVIIIEICS
jgi:hypothetical protein